MKTFPERLFAEIQRLRIEAARANCDPPTIDVSMHPETRMALERDLPRDMSPTYGPDLTLPDLPEGAFWRVYDALFFEDRREIRGAAFLRVNGKGASSIAVADQASA